MITSKRTKIHAERIVVDIETIASYSECEPAIGFSRPTFSPAWLKARDYVIREAESVGAMVRIDSVGNVHLRRKDPVGPPWLSGSHLDSVPTGGKYDGVAGVVTALEVLRSCPTAPLEVVIFAEEEGTTFQRGMLGSLGWVGKLSAGELQTYRNDQGVDFLTAGAACGVVADRLECDRLRPSTYRGFIEIHIEQGNYLWRRQLGIGIVKSIHGRRQYHVRILGENNHAGSTRMEDRRDALTGAARIILGLELLASELSHEVEHTVITVGRIQVVPNALNVIPGSVHFTIDFRSPDERILAKGEQRILQLVSDICDQRRLTAAYERSESLPALSLDDQLCDLAAQAAAHLKIPATFVSSGALHDAAILAPFLPTTMIFVASRDGISHHPEEYSEIDHLVCAAEILAEMVMR